MGGGISVAQNLIAAFGRVAPENNYYVTVPPDLGYEVCCSVAPNCRYLAYRHSGLAGRWWWETFRLQNVVKQFRADVIFNVANRGFLTPVAPQATLIQDAHLFYPFSSFGRISLREAITFAYHRNHLRKSMRYTSLLFCQTEVARRRFLAMYGYKVPIEICPNNVSCLAGRPDTNVEIPSRLRGYEGKFKLFVPARYYPHKNLEVIIEVYRRFRHELRDVTTILTIGADDSQNAGRLIDNVRAMGLEKNIISVGVLKQEDLAAFYLHTDVMFLPTLLESHSGTYMEAMTYGRAILTSDLDFAHTVCGNAALYFDPRKPDEICETILDAKNNRKLRNALARAGASRCSEQGIGWDEIAVGVLDKLQGLCERRSN